MKNINIKQSLIENRVVPVVKINDLEDAGYIAKAILKAGVNIMEITLRTPCAMEAIAKISNDFPEIVVGAGTVLNIAQAKKAMQCGAKFIVSPGFDEELVAFAIEQNIPIIPGIATASELQKAIKMGLTIVKLFPAEQVGGISMIKALSSVYNDVLFMPTGGINESNIAEYLKQDQVIACGASYIVSEKLISSKNWNEIEKFTREAKQK